MNLLLKLRHLSFLLPLLFLQVSCLNALSAPPETSSLQGAHDQPVQNSQLTADTIPCENPGWRPTDFGLKDHHIFEYDGYFYLVAIYIPGENRFAYGRSKDLCDWETLPSLFPIHIQGTWDEERIWAPHVFEEAGIYYMYYTGVTKNLTQSIMLATTTNPSDPHSWRPHGMIFQPNHDGMVWENGLWADCRDPNVIKIGDVYYLYYTGQDINNGIVGLATSSSPMGPWKDLGSTLNIFDGIPESPTLIEFSGIYYLFYNHSDRSETYRIGASPTGPWGAETHIQPGWAYEAWQSSLGEWFLSYLTDYSVTITPLVWDVDQTPPRPIVGSASHRSYFPIIFFNH